MKITSGFTSALALTLSLLCIIPTAHADFRKALEAYQARDGATMLKEVKDAVDKKNDDGLMLFLKLLKQNPSTWQSFMELPQQNELLANLKAITKQNSLQSQFRLAIIPRQDEQGRDNQTLIDRLKPLAINGYSPAALYIYLLSVSDKNQSPTGLNKSFGWLVKAAELGNPEASFRLGMLYLNMADDNYGCENELQQCPAKDEEKGWYWMKMTEKYMNHQDIVIGDYAYYMGNLYSTGIGKQKPDFEKSYFWFSIARLSMWESVSRERTESKLQDLSKHHKFTEHVSFDKLNSFLVKLQQKKSILTNKNQPITAFYMYKWGVSKEFVEIYSDGKTIFRSASWPELIEGVDKEIHLNSVQLNSLTAELKKLNIQSWPALDDINSCHFIAGCGNYQKFLLTSKVDQGYVFSLLGTETLGCNDCNEPVPMKDYRIANLLTLLGKYFPDDFPVNKLRCNTGSVSMQKECDAILNNVKNIADKKGIKK